MKVGRNDPCPCGSGKKYKKCCIPVYKPQSLEEIVHETIESAERQLFGDSNKPMLEIKEKPNG